MYYSTQTLVHKKTRQLARLADDKEHSTFHWGNHPDGTLFVDEKGEKFVADIHDYTHVEDEWGNPYAQQPQKGQFVDISSKKYVNASPTDLKGMRERLLRKIREGAKMTTLAILDLFAKKEKEKRFVLNVQDDHGFSFTKYSTIDEIDIYSPKVGSYFNFPKYFLRYLKNNGWKIVAVRVRQPVYEFSVDKNPYSFPLYIATKGKQTLNVNNSHQGFEVSTNGKIVTFNG